MKNDYLRECMEEFRNTPLDEFNKVYCLVCANSDCSRSRANNTLFNIRTTNWENDLFYRVPRLDDTNPLAKDIISKWYKPATVLATSEPKSETIELPDQTESTKETAPEAQEKHVGTQSDTQLAPKAKKPKKTPRKPTETDTNSNTIQHQVKAKENTTVIEVTPAYPNINNPFLPANAEPEPSEPADVVIPLGGTFVLD